METLPFENAQRVHTALTASLEKRLLLWLARRTPAAVNSDHLTLLALVAQISAGAVYALAGPLWLANGFIFLNWLGDSLDGTVARVRHQQRPRYGFYVDHIVDTFGALALVAGLGCSGYVHWQVAVAVLVGFYVLAIESYLATYTMGRFHLSHGLFGPTELRLVMMVGNCFLAKHRYVDIAGRHFLLFDFGGGVAVVGMAAMALVAVTRHVVVLYRAEPIG